MLNGKGKMRLFTEQLPPKGKQSPPQEVTSDIDDETFDDTPKKINALHHLVV